MPVPDLDMQKRFYDTLDARLTRARQTFGRPMTLADKILAVHLSAPLVAAPVRGKDYVNLRPDRVAMQDATAQMALLQFMQAGRDTSAVPATIHCDHLICARDGADADLNRALKENAEVYGFLESVARRYGIGYWRPGAGIIHQIILENYAFPGGLMIGTDSHTPNAGGLGMIAVGVGGADAVDVMAGMDWELRWPKVTGVRLTGGLNGWASPKDVILVLLGKLTVKGGTGRIFEYFGEGAASLSCTGKATITNMGAELGATASVFTLDANMLDYLKVTGRSEVAAMAERARSVLVPDPEVAASPVAFYDDVIEIDLSTVEPMLVGPHTPDLARPVSGFKAEIEAKGWPTALSAGLLGSCTNASYEDIARAASVAIQALTLGRKAKSAFYITPGSARVYETVKRDGYLKTLSDAGGIVLANGCGQCIGQWDRTDPIKEKPNAIATTFNRNFQARNDGSVQTLAFIGSPETVTALALTGELGFDPAHHAYEGGARLLPPSGPALPVKGFADDGGTWLSNDRDPKSAVRVATGSERLQLLTPFVPWDGLDPEGLLLLLKAKGKCTTDHISPAGPWLKYRGHLDRISDNAFLGAINAFTGEKGRGVHVLSGETQSFPELARAYKAKGQGWVVVGDENYGEGSSREHAAMSPRFLGCRAIITRSFARIHETNLKKQGIFPFTFENVADYDRLRFDDRLSLIGLSRIAPDSKVMLKVLHSDGSEESVALRHTLSAQQIEWIRHGSALNLIAAQAKGA